MCAAPEKTLSPDAGEILGRLLIDDADENRRAKNELDLARQVQVRLFQGSFPDLPGYEIFGGTAPSRGVSGDYYEIVERKDGSECVILIADVGGQGLPASILTGFLEALTSISIEKGLAPCEVLNTLSVPFFKKTPRDQFATMALAVITPDKGTIQYASAGHPPGIIVRNSGQVDWLQPTGIPIGVLANAEYLQETTGLSSGDLLVLYSDGYPFAIDPDEIEFGADRLAGVIARHRNDRLPIIAARLEVTIKELAAGRPVDDDRTLVIVRRSR